MNFADCSLEELTRRSGHACACGMHHDSGVEYLKIGKDAIIALPEALRVLGVKKPLVVCDENTKRAAWDKTRAVLAEAGIAYSLFEFTQKDVEPDEYSVGALCMDADASCDAVLALGSGVINDCCKVLARMRGQKSIVVGTAPSMDGYASNSSAMIRDRVKVSLYNACPAAIIADTEIMRNAPARMLKAGLGDMLAKYIALCEWRISALVNGEHYCENIASLVRQSLKKCVSGAPGLLARDESATREVATGLILSGIAMSYAKVSRPASGLEHYFSHIFEMMALDRGTPYELHGIQVGVGTYITFRLYDRVRSITPSRERALAFMRGFSQEAWRTQTHMIFGKAADALIRAEEEREHKNDPARHIVRLNRILDNWDEIMRIIDEELPPTAQIEALMRNAQMPMLPRDIGVSAADARVAYIGSRDLRDKYLTSSFLWDLGMQDEMAAAVEEICR